MRTRRLVAFLALAVSLVIYNSCGGGSAPAPPPPPALLGVTLSASSLTIFQDGAPASIDVTVSRPSGTIGSVTLMTSILPAGIAAQVESPGSGNKGKVTFTTSPQNGGAGTHLVEIRASAGGANGSANLNLVVGIVASVGAAAVGRIEMFMSTSVAPASWTDRFFILHPEATAPLTDLNPQHINLLVLERDIPQVTRATPASVGAWDFTYIDGILNPIFTAGDRSPLYQIALGPPFMYRAPGEFLDMTYQEFADYCVRLVKYYNTGGFTDGNGHFHESQSPWPITYWGIYNEPNNNGLTPQEYVDMYNVVVPQMLDEDPSLKFVALELSDFGDEPQRYLPTFLNNVVAPVDVLATHYYSSCNQRDTDQMLLDTVPNFASRVSYIYSQLEARPTFANVPVWVTENNVNADFGKDDGTSVCNPAQTFVADRRGSSAFFAAWRPFVFSRLAQASARALHHFAFYDRPEINAQFGEVDVGTAATYLSYWVDYWLGRYFPAPPSSDVLQLEVSDSATVEILATLRGSDGAIVVMIANHAVAASTDNNGAGAPRTVRLDVTALWPLSWGKQLTLDARTNPAVPPNPQLITPSAQMDITLPGYGVTFLELK